MTKPNLLPGWSQVLISNHTRNRRSIFPQLPSLLRAYFGILSSLVVTLIFWIYFTVKCVVEFAVIYIYIEEGFSVPCSKLVWVGFKRTSSHLLCTLSNRMSYLANNEMCLLVHRIKWPRSLSHRQVDCSWSSFRATVFISHRTNFWPIQTKISYWTKRPEFVSICWHVYNYLLSNCEANDWHSV